MVDRLQSGHPDVTHTFCILPNVGELEFLQNVPEAKEDHNDEGKRSERCGNRLTTGKVEDVGAIENLDHHREIFRRSPN